MNLAFEEIPEVSIQSKSLQDFEQQPIEIKAESDDENAEQKIEKLLDYSLPLNQNLIYSPDDGDKIPGIDKKKANGRH